MNNLVSDLANLLATMNRIKWSVASFGNPTCFEGRAGARMSQDDWISARKAARDVIAGLQAFLRMTEAADGHGPSRF